MKDQGIDYLIKKLKSGNLTADEKERLLTIFQKTSGKKSLLNYFNSSYRNIIDELDMLPENKHKELLKDKLLNEITGKDPKPLGTTYRKLRLKWISAAVALLAGLGVYYYILTHRLENHHKIKWNTVQTKHGERKKITLPDLTVITLNGHTTLQYTSSGNSNYRLVKLQGEAFFEVTPNADKPFVVVTKDFSTLVKGTSFNIDSDISKIVEVCTGIVQVFSIKQDNALLYLEHDKHNNASSLSEVVTELDSGQSIYIHQKKNNDTVQAITNESKNRITRVVNVLKGQKVKLNPNQSLSISEFDGKVWTNNELVYMNETLGQVAAKIYRNYGDSVYVTPELRDKNITITFRNKNKGEVLQTISEISNGKLTKDKTSKNWIITKD